MRFKNHQEKWKNCTSCVLHQKRTKVVLAKGVIPCDILFIGEAPGQSEDVIGRPFVGPAGKLLDRIVEAAVADNNFKLAHTNLVACIPILPDSNGKKVEEPPKECIIACRPRLEEFITMAKPRLIVTVGSLAEKHLPYTEVPTVYVTHPAAILRMEPVQSGLIITRSIVTISDAIMEHL